MSGKTDRRYFWQGAGCTGGAFALFGVLMWGLYALVTVVFPRYPIVEDAVVVGVLILALASILYAMARRVGDFLRDTDDVYRKLNSIGEIARREREPDA